MKVFLNKLETQEYDEDPAFRTAVCREAKRLARGRVEIYGIEGYRLDVLCSLRPKRPSTESAFESAYRATLAAGEKPPPKVKHRLSPADARALVKKYGSVKRAAKMSGVPRTSLRDLLAVETALPGLPRARTRALRRLR